MRTNGKWTGVADVQCSACAALNVFVYAVMVLSSIAIGVYSLINPIAIWDMIGYAGAARSLYEADPDLIHRQTYEALRLAVTPAEFVILTDDGSYRSAMFADSLAFNQQLPFYKIRVFYVGLLSLAGSLGFSMFTVGHVLSALFGGLTLLVLFLGFRRLVHPLLWLAVPLIFFVYSRELSISRSAGVDSFAFFWVALCSVAFVRNSKVLILLLPLAVLVRTDLILVVLMLFGLMGGYRTASWLAIAAGLLATLLLYAGVNVWAGNYGWSALFYFVFVSDLTATLPQQYAGYSVALGDYLHYLCNPPWFSPVIWLAVASWSAALFVYVGGAKEEFERTNSNKLLQLATVGVVYVLLHYLLFPVIWVRFFFGFYMLMTLALLSALSVWWAGSVSLPLKCTRESGLLHRNSAY